MSENDFNPTEHDLLNLDGKILDLKVKKQDLVRSKLSVENSLSILHNQYKDCVFNSDEFKRIKNRRQELKMEFNRIEMEIRKVNQDIVGKTKIKEECKFHIASRNKKASVVKHTDLSISKLIKLKDKYQSFSKDRTRINSMRIMAAEIRDELDDVIKLLK